MKGRNPTPWMVPRTRRIRLAVGERFEASQEETAIDRCQIKHRPALGLRQLRRFGRCSECASKNRSAWYGFSDPPMKPPIVAILLLGALASNGPLDRLPRDRAGEIVRRAINYAGGFDTWTAK